MRCAPSAGVWLSSRRYFARGFGGSERTVGDALAATVDVSGPHAAVSPLQHSAWFTPNIGQPLRRHAA